MTASELPEHSTALEPHKAPRHQRYVRHVSGGGARCGCGGMSALHVGTDLRGGVTPETSTFLCEDCVFEAVAWLREARGKQPPYWPGDEERDEPYVHPRTGIAYWKVEPGRRRFTDRQEAVNLLAVLNDPKSRVVAYNASGKIVRET